MPDGPESLLAGKNVSSPLPNPGELFAISGLMVRIVRNLMHRARALISGFEQEKFLDRMKRECPDFPGLLLLGPIHASVKTEIGPLKGEEDMAEPDASVVIVLD